MAGAAQDLDTVKVGMFGSLKKGVDWVPSTELPTDENPFSVGTRGVADTPGRKGREAYANRLYDDYLVDKVEASFKNASGNPITTIDQVPKVQKDGRFYGKDAGDSLKTYESFKTAVKELRKGQFTKKLAAKQSSTKKNMNTLEKGVTAQTRAELDVMTKLYAQKKDELQKRLQATFEEQKKQFLINREHNSQEKLAQYKTIVPSGPRGPVDLPGALEKTGAEVIGSLPKPRETRKRHRFIHLLVRPSKGLPETVPQSPPPPSPAIPKDETYSEPAPPPVPGQAPGIRPQPVPLAQAKAPYPVPAQMPEPKPQQLYPDPATRPPEGYNYLANGPAGGKRKTKRKGKSARKNVK